MSTPALSISNLRKVYSRGTVAVEDISLTIPERQFFGFLGPNGAGKSTTIHCITGIAEPTSGTIEIFGLDAVKDYRAGAPPGRALPAGIQCRSLRHAAPDRGLDGRLFRHARRGCARSAPTC